MYSSASRASTLHYDLCEPNMDGDAGARDSRETITSWVVKATASVPPSSLPAVPPVGREWTGSGNGGTQQPRPGYTHQDPLLEVVNQYGTPRSRSEDSEYWLPNVLGSHKPSFGFSGRDIYIQSTLPPIAPPPFDDAGLHLHANPPGV